MGSGWGAARLRQLQRVGPAHAVFGGRHQHPLGAAILTSSASLGWIPNDGTGLRSLAGFEELSKRAPCIPEWIPIPWWWPANASEPIPLAVC